MNMNENTSIIDTNAPLTDAAVSDIDKALAAAQARRAAKAAGSTETDNTEECPVTTATGEAPAAKPAKPRLSDAERAVRDEARKQAAAERKTVREAARAERKANNVVRVAHMAKVEKAAERLLPLGDAAELIFNESTTNLSAAELANLANHISHYNRVKATERAVTQKLDVGQIVNVTGGDPRYIGRVGTLAKVQRIRVYVTVDGLSKDLYLFSSEVTPVGVEPAEVEEDIVETAIAASA